MLTHYDYLPYNLIFLDIYFQSLNLLVKLVPPSSVYDFLLLVLVATVLYGVALTKRAEVVLLDWEEEELEVSEDFALG